MKQHELKKLIESGEVGEIYLMDHPLGWSVWAYDAESDKPNRVCKLFGNELETGRYGVTKRYTSVDRAISALCKMGYKGYIVIEPQR